ncbi:hypothetical protein FRC20_007220 [Serendipita sp. 405]|nr:hypothetical protein FRC20_007220 [Serendipita sp. 405]
MLPSNRTSMDINDQSTMVSPNDSPKFKNSGSPSRVESMDLEAAAASASEKEKRPEEAITTTTSNVEDLDLERRRSAMREAWPDAELDADPTLAKEALQEEKDIFLVTFDRDDPLDPKVCYIYLSSELALTHLSGFHQNWGRVYRWYLCVKPEVLARMDHIDTDIQDICIIFTRPQCLLCIFGPFWDVACHYARISYVSSRRYTNRINVYSWIRCRTIHLGTN